MNNIDLLNGLISYSGFHKEATFVNPDVNNDVLSMGYDFDVRHTTWECDWTEKKFKLKSTTITVGEFVALGAIFARYGEYYGEDAPDLSTFAEGSRGIISLVPHLKVLTDENGELGIKAEKGVEVHKRLPLIVVIDGIPKITTVMVKLPADE